MSGYIICLRTNGLKYAYLVENGVIDAYQFYGDSTLAAVSIGTNITEISEYAFFGCDYLRSVHFSNTVTKIGNNAFEGCVNLKSVYVESPTITCGEDAFKDVGLNGGYYYNDTLHQLYYDFFEGYGWKAFSRNSINFTEVTLGDTPVRIEMNGSGEILEPLKPYSCTVSLITDNIYKDMYSPTAQGVNVKVKDETNDDILFYGYVTPCAYNQDWQTVADELQLECISPISSLEYFKYKNSYLDSEIVSVENILKHCFQKANYYDNFYFPNNYKIDGVEIKHTSYDEDRLTNYINGSGNIAYPIGTDFSSALYDGEIEVVFTTANEPSKYFSEVILSDWDNTIEPKAFELQIYQMATTTTPTVTPYFILSSKDKLFFFPTPCVYGHTYKMNINCNKWIVEDLTLGTKEELVYGSTINFSSNIPKPIYVGCLDSQVDFFGKWHRVTFYRRGIKQVNLVPYCSDELNGYYDFYDSVKEVLIKNMKSNRNENSVAVWEEEGIGISEAFLSNIYLNENNFFDDDDERTPWTCKDVLEEFCKYLGVSMTEHKGNVYFVDYNAISNGNGNFFNYSQTNPNTINLIEDITIDENLYASDGTNISYDEIYNKISVEDNLYEMESYVIDLFEGIECLHEEDYIENNWTDDEGVIHHDFWRYYHNPNYNFLYYYPQRQNHKFTQLADKVFTDEQVTEWLSIKTQDEYDTYVNKWFVPTDLYSEKYGCLVVNPITVSAWTHEGETYYLDHFEDRVQLLNRFYIGAWLLKNMNFDETSIPKGYDWDDIICFSFGTYNIDNPLDLHQYIGNNKLEVIKSKQQNNLVWSDAFVDTYFNFRGDVMTTHAGSGAHTDDEFKGGFHLGRKPCAALPKDWWPEGAEIMFGGYRVSCDFSNAIFQAYDDMLAPVQFGGGTSMLNNWLPLIESCWYALNIGKQDGYLVQVLKGTDIRGDLQFSLCAPTAFMQSGKTSNATYAFVKGFEFNVVSSNGRKAKLEIDEEEEDDIVYTNTINESYVTEFDDLELKINTQVVDRNFSYSSVIYKDEGGTPFFLNKLVDLTIDKSQIQEYNLIEKYFNHYSTPKLKLSATFKGVVNPYSVMKENNVNKNFCIDGYDFDVRLNNSKTNIIEY